MLVVSLYLINSLLYFDLPGTAIEPSTLLPTHLTLQLITVHRIAICDRVMGELIHLKMAARLQLKWVSSLH